MKIYLSGMTKNHLQDFNRRCPGLRPNVLLSYALLDQNYQALITNMRPMMDSICLDSGVYPLRNCTNEDIVQDVFEKFTIFSKNTLHVWDYIFNFDRYFSKDAYELNLEYQMLLEKSGIPAVPVVHNIYNDEIERILHRGLPNNNMIAIGQCKGRTTMKNLRPAVMRIHDRKRKIHFFGMSEFNLLAQLPFWSCDSTSWVKYAGMGIVPYWNTKRDSFDKTDRIYFPKNEDAEVKSGNHYYRTYGYLRDFEEYLADKLQMELKDLYGENAEFNRAIVNMHYYCMLQGIINEIHRCFDFNLPA